MDRPLHSRKMGTTFRKEQRSLNIPRALQCKSGEITVTCLAIKCRTGFSPDSEGICLSDLGAAESGLR